MRFARTLHVARKERAEAAAKTVFAFMAAAMIVPLVLIVGYLVYVAWPSLGWEFIVDVPRRGMTEGGIWPAFVGTLYLVGISLLVSAPIGVLAAVYLNEYAKDNWFNRVMHLAVINLAGVPSIVHALFGLGAFVYAARLGYSILSASLTLAIMTLPVIIASTREALASVPMAFREACWNVGATRWQTIRAVVLPNSISGILTGVILQVSRAAGETAPDHVHGGGLLQGRREGRPLPLRPPRAVHGALHAPLHPLHPGAEREGVAPLRHRRGPPRLRSCSSTPPPSRSASSCAAGRSGEDVTAIVKEIEVQDLRLAYGSKEVLHGISFDIYRNEIFGRHRPRPVGQDLAAALPQPHDRLHRLGARSRAPSGWTARTCGRTKDVFALRRKIGMVAPLPVGLPLSIYDNVAFAPRCAGMTGKSELDAIVEHCLRQAALWDEVKDRLDSLGTELSGGPAAAPHHRPRPLPPARDPLPRRVLHRHRPRDHHAHRGRAEGAATRA